MTAGTMDAENLITCLYRHHHSALLTFATRLTAGDHQWAEDVAQETLLRAWRTAVKVDESMPPVRSWLFTVARRVVVDEYRRRAARPAEVGDAALEHVSGGDQIDGRLSSLMIADALACLSEQHQAVLRELYFYGNTADKAANRLGVPVGTVKSRSHRAHRRLATLLAHVRDVSEPPAAHEENRTAAPAVGIGEPRRHDQGDRP
jgi:RNA polymerase sigma-70 factor (ECF subfamily)